MNNNNNKLASTVGQKWTQAQRNIWTIAYLPIIYLGVFVGLVLGDAHLRKAEGHNNAILEFSQSTKHMGFFLFIFELLAPFCQTLYRLTHREYKGAEFSVISCATRSLPFITTLYRLFVVNGIKVIPCFPLIYLLLSPIALAVWIICDGTWRRSGVILCTDSFSIEGVEILRAVLERRYGLLSTLRIHDGKYPRIYIRSHSMSLLRDIVTPYMHSSILYKVGL